MDRTAKHRLLVVPRWGGGPQHDWYPWLRRTLPEGAFREVVVADLPNPSVPTIDAWRDGIAGLVGGDPEALATTALVGHSVGCQAILHFLGTLEEGVHVGPVLFVAGWWTVDAPWDSIRPWLDARIDAARIRARAQRFEVLVSTNDPFTASHETTARLFRQRLGAQVRVVAEAKHFNATEEPVVLEAIMGMA